MMSAQSVLSRLSDFSSMNSGTMLATPGRSMSTINADQRTPENGIR